MRHLGAVTIILICLFGSSPVHSASLVFQAVPTSPTSICAPSCYQVRMFIDDPSRNLAVQSIQVEVWVNGATVPVIATYPGTNSNTSAGNSLRLNEDGEGLAGFPWSLSSSVAGTNYWNAPNPDLLAVSAAAAPFTVDSLQAQVDAYNAFCNPALICQIQEAGLAENRIFFGRFNIRNPGTSPSVRLGFIAGNGPAATDPELGFIRLSGQTLPIEFAAPEPTSALLIGIAVAALILPRVRKLTTTDFVPLVVVSLLPAPALSAPITWRFDGFVTVVGTVLSDPGVRVGNPIQGSLTFDPELATGQSCFRGASEYSCTYSIPAAMEVTIRDHTVEAVGAGRLLLREFVAPVTEFQFGASAFTYDGATPPSLSTAILTIQAPPAAYPDSLPSSEFSVPEVDGNFDLFAVQFREDPNGVASGFQAALVRLEAPEVTPTFLLLPPLAAVGLTRLRNRKPPIQR